MRAAAEKAAAERAAAERAAAEKANAKIAAAVAEPGRTERPQANENRQKKPASALVAPAAAPSWRSGRRRTAVALAVVGLLGATGLASAIGRPSSASKTVSAPLPKPSADSVAAPAEAAPTPSAPVESAPKAPAATATAATATAATKAAATTTPLEPKSDKAAKDTEEDKPVSVPTVPRLATIAVPTINIAPAASKPREIVRADEFVPMAARKGDEATARPASNGAAPVDLATARREAERAVQAFATALSTRDIAALRRAAPDMPAEVRDRWATTFRDAIRVRADLSVIDVQVDGNVIAARVRNQIDVYRPGAARPEKVDAPSMALLVRDSTGWRLSTAP
jgi:serine/threonine-protein kinase